MYSNTTNYSCKQHGHQSIFTPTKAATSQSATNDGYKPSEAEAAAATARTYLGLHGKERDGETDERRDASGDEHAAGAVE